MDRHPNELPIRSKVEMAKDIGQIVRYLHTGQKSAANSLLEDLKARAVYMDEQIQRAVLAFAEQVQFQYNYDSCHKVTSDVQQAASQLIEELGFQPPVG